MWGETAEDGAFYAFMDALKESGSDEIYGGKYVGSPVEKEVDPERLPVNFRHSSKSYGRVNKSFEDLSSLKTETWGKTMFVKFKLILFFS